VVHVVLAVVLVWIPELRRGPRVPLDATVVELVGSLPGPPAATTSPPVEAPPPPEPQAPPEGVTVQEKPPAPKPKKKAPEKKSEPKKPPQPQPAAPQGPTDTATENPSAAGQIAGSAAAGGSVSALDLGDVAFAWYRAAVANALYGSWRRPILSGLREPVEVRVAFEIMRDGTVRGLRVDESSGVPVLDRSALRAVDEAAPLPALPTTLREPYLPATIVFRLYPEGT